MSNTRFDEELELLKAAFGEISTTTGGAGERMWRITSAHLPPGCSPTSTPVLLILQEAQRPQIYVKRGIKLPNGNVPRSTSDVQFLGEAWTQFSFTFPWEWTDHTLEQFVATSLQRFAKTE